MKHFIIFLAFVAAACTYNIEEIPDHMRDRLDRFVALKKQWETKWSSMTETERQLYEQILLNRLQNLPQLTRERTHERLLSMPQEHLTKLRDYLRRRFPSEKSQVFASDVEEIESFINALPEMIREKLSETLFAHPHEATAYTIKDYDSDFDFPDIPQLVDIPEAVGYSHHISEELRERLDEFLMKREEWKHKWEKLPAEKREVLEAYINEKMK